MTPLSEIERLALSKGNYALNFAVHKHNSYITDRTITLEEAACAVIVIPLQTYTIAKGMNEHANVLSAIHTTIYAV
jgi:hypothetical protein